VGASWAPGWRRAVATRARGLGEIQPARASCRAVETLGPSQINAKQSQPHQPLSFLVKPSVPPPLIPCPGPHHCPKEVSEWLDVEPTSTRLASCAAAGGGSVCLRPGRGAGGARRGRLFIVG